MKKRVADLIMDILVCNGITDCFCVVGGGSMHLDNALGKKKEMNKIFNHHEQACAIAAEAYSRFNGKMALVLVTSGPGATNTLTGVMGAWQDSLPMIVLSGQVRTSLSVESTGLPLRFRGSQEFDIINSVKNMTKYAKRVENPLDIKAELEKAIIYAKTGRRGPVWLDIPLDVQMAEINIDELKGFEEDIAFKSIITKEKIDMITSELNNAKRPIVLLGNGVCNSGSTEKIRDFFEKVGIPIIAAAQASDVMYRDAKNYYGIAGIIGWRSGNFVLQNSDYILAIGTSLGFKTTGYNQEGFAPNAKIVMVDADEFEHLKPGLRVSDFIHSDVSDFINTWKENYKSIKIEDSWIEYCNKVKNRFDVYEATCNFKGNENVSSYCFWKVYDELAPEDNISVLGNNTGISSRIQIGVKKKLQRIIANNNCGSMGYDLPAAIGAAIATKKEVVCATGDGSIMMNLQELQTIKYNNLPIKIIIFSNHGYSAIRQTSKNFFNNEYVGCDYDSGINFPSFKKIAEAFNYNYNYCEFNSNIKESIDWLFEVKGPSILEVEQVLDDPITPKIMSRIDKDGNFQTPELHDMYPFIADEELKSLMIKD